MGGGSFYIQPTLGHPSPSSPPSPPPPPPSQQERQAPVGYPQENPEVYNYGQFQETYMQRRAPLGIVLADKVINGTWGSLSLDLKRPQLPHMGARTSLFTFRQPVVQAPPPVQYGGGGIGGFLGQFGGGGSGGRRRQQRPTRQQLEAQRQMVDYDALPNISFGQSGARVKALRHISFGPPMDFTKYGRQFTAPSLDFGAGFDFEFDTAELRPLARLKVRDVASLKILPYPAVKFQKRLRVGTSGFAVRLSYECPLQHLNKFFAPPARLMVTVDNAVDTGVRLTQSGLEFAANKWLLNGAVRLRGAGILRLPSELPIDEEQAMFGFEAKRLGIKARW